MRADAFLFIGIIIFIFVAWVATGGPSHPISFSGPFITPVAPGVGGAASTSGGYRLSDAGATHASQAQINGTFSKAQQEVVTLEKSIVSSQRFGTPSSYQGLITIRHNVGSLLTDDPDKEYVTLSVSTRAPVGGISISGWYLLSEAVGHSLRIPEGVNLAHTGSVNSSAPIILEPGQTAVILVGDSPVGMSFRENMCTGYFDQFQNFTPLMPHLCPVPSSDFDRFYLGNEHSLDACKAYVKQVPRCTVPLDEPSNTSDDCFHFIDAYLNYNGCVVAHTGDQNFFGRTWRIYLGRDDEFFTKTHDTIKLLDDSGRTVDLLSY